MKSVPFFIYAIVLAVAGNSSVETSGSVQWSRLTREISCREHEYPHNGVCCLTCPAGHYAKKHCERAGERGQCEPCEFGTFTEHPNGLERCLTCDKCREDQEMTSVCTSTKNTVCQCKAGRYCANEHACEVCKKCRKCEADEEVVKNCTSTSNSECRKKPPPDNPSTDGASRIGIVVIAFVITLLLLVVPLAIGFHCWKKRMRKKASEIDSSPCEEVKIAVDEEDERTTEEIQNNENAGLEESETLPFLPGITLVGGERYAGDDEDKGIGESLPTTTNSSQISLPSHISPQPSPRAQRQPIIREDGQCRRLVPLNGEYSLMQAFDIIGENLGSQYRNRFFRLIGLSDNTIDDTASSRDAVYKLLKSWMEKEGLKADINDLIQALLELQQKLSAETVIHEVIDKGYFRFENDSS